MNRLIYADKLLVDLRDLTIYGHDIHDFLKVKILKQPTIIEVERCIENQPTIEAEPVRHAHWIDTKDGIQHECSDCHIFITGSYGNYCSNCGAKMDEKTYEK